MMISISYALRVGLSLDRLVCCFIRGSRIVGLLI